MVKTVVKEGKTKKIIVAKNKVTVAFVANGEVTVEQQNIQISKAPERWKLLPKTKAEAMAAGIKHFYTGKPCKNGHIAPRHAQRTIQACLTCVNERNRLLRKKKLKATDDLMKAAPQIVRNRNERTVTDRAEAARHGMMFYFDPDGCAKGHKEVIRYTKSGFCSQCHSTINTRGRTRAMTRSLTVDNKNILANPTIVIEG